ncbi:phospholipid carrier-dependent glycosyltransferase [candidate division KSB3 bacterium]|uniref:Phospholipid carrier-dependent glycosyltransferase n=1 Tax=candidate division KSB3 bacterium TaxID=2044937 RepID=A0A9D5Q839_9BACT|nr:phospholipid carrier-dependent glycosyltransferase [candidate division KSB3 bacterium]MBD3327539.1 phospholipid carrier-dependent glycosyltransferase [candidate division KSB3 bacterium]
MKRSAAVVAVLVLGIGLRWSGLDWSLPAVFHPDETRVLYAVQELSWENLNPHFFAYGSLPIYLLKVVHTASQRLAGWLGLPPHVNFFLAGRAVSALFGSLTLLLLYGFGRRCFSQRVALLSTAFLACTVLHIQLAHFLTVDVLLTFFIVLAVFLLTILVETPTLRAYLLPGVAIGLALATKISALPLYAVFLAAHLLVVVKSRWRQYPTRYAPVWLWGRWLLALGLSGVVFLLCEPYALLDFHEFWRQITEQSDMVRGMIQPPYVIQYEKTTPYFYQLKHLLLYAMGLPLGGLTLLGTVFMGVVTIKRVYARFSTRRFHTIDRQSQSLLLILVWIIPVFAMVGGFRVKFLRYMLPLIPFFCLLGVVWIDALIARFPTWKHLITGLVIAVIGFSAFYALAFVSIYHREDPRTQASRWIYEHVEPGKTILTEVWEFVTLVPVGRHHGSQYRLLHLDLYQPDTDAKVRQIAEHLHEADLIFLATKRIYGSILRVPQRYPLTANYYKLLFDGSLGFRPVQPFTLYPSLFGITFNDDFADESFSVYDHPKTILFQKTNALSADDIYARILTSPPIQATDSLLDRLIAFPAQEPDYAPIAADQPQTQGEESAVADPGSAHPMPQWQAVVLWLATVELLALLALPLTMLTFRRLPDAGYAAAKVVGILLPSYGVWLCVNLGVFSYTRSHITLMIGLLYLAALLMFLKYRTWFLERWRAKWRVFAVHESVFLLAYGAFLLFRAYNPDIFWSESSMDFSFVNVLTRTKTLPPPDPWISGFPLNYYYFGHYLVATLTKLTGILPQVTYNLAFALFPALVIVEVFSLLYNLTTRYLHGAIGVLFATILGNLDGLFLLVDRWRGAEGYYRFFRPAHEVIPYTVHEFPIWTFIFVDLHAHLLNMPFLLATFLLGLNLLCGAQNGHPDERSQHPRSWVWLETLLSLLIVGTLGVISSWDYPTGVIFLLLIALVLGYKHISHAGHVRKAALHPLAYVAGVIIPGSLVCYAPFYASFSRSGMGLGLVGAATTPLAAMLTMFGVLLFLIGSYLSLRSYEMRFNYHPWRLVSLLLLALTGVYLLARALFQIDYATLLVVLFVLIWAIDIFLKRQRSGIEFHALPIPHLYIWICLSYACLIIAGCEVVFVRDFLQGGAYKRMNTIFKFYIPAWFLLAFVAAYVFPKLLRRITQMRPGKAMTALWKYAWLLLCGLLLLAAAVFPVMAVYARRHQQDVYPRTYLPLTLNGLAYLRAANPDEYQAIQWLNSHVQGTPVILEAVGPDYHYEYARISANTGLPAVLGWRSHVDQREHWHATHQRAADVKRIYTSHNIRKILHLLRYYQVEYIYVGATERRDFSEQDLHTFRQYPEYFVPVFQSGHTTIYRVQYAET